MKQVGQHLGSTARHAGPARTLWALVHGGVRDRDAATWTVAAVLTLAWWAALAWTLQEGASGSRPTAGAVLAGTWGISLLPVHCARRFRRFAPREPATETVATGAVGDASRATGPGQAEGADRDESDSAPSGR